MYTILLLKTQKFKTDNQTASTSTLPPIAAKLPENPSRIEAGGTGSGNDTGSGSGSEAGGINI